MILNRQFYILFIIYIMRSAMPAVSYNIIINNLITFIKLLLYVQDKSYTVYL